MNIDEIKNQVIAYQTAFESMPSSAKQTEWEKYNASKKTFKGLATTLLNQRATPEVLKASIKDIPGHEKACKKIDEIWAKKRKGEQKYNEQQTNQQPATIADFQEATARYIDTYKTLETTEAFQDLRKKKKSIKDAIKKLNTAPESVQELKVAINTAKAAKRLSDKTTNKIEYWIRKLSKETGSSLLKV